MTIKTFLRKIHKRIFERIIGKIFFKNQGDILKRQRLFGIIIKYVNQSLNERGICPPWIYTKQECLDFWKAIDSTSSNQNRPENYVYKDRHIIDFLHSFWMPEVRYDDGILELGCNAGGNLRWLNELGYNNLSGIEINPYAIEQMYKTFPSLKGRIKISICNIEDGLKAMPDKSIDVVFTMGVAMHIHPSDNFIFQEMVRVSKRYICILEPEIANSNYVFARNYRRIFANIGIPQVKSTLITDQAFPGTGQAGLAVRLFRLG